MKIGRTLSIGLVSSVLILALFACQREEGPAEKAGKAVDKTLDKVGQQVEKAGEKIQDAAKGDQK